jgi:hypothetical protein
MYTVIETPTFAADADNLWSEEERGAFCAWIAGNLPAYILKAVREELEND